LRAARAGPVKREGSSDVSENTLGVIFEENVDVSMRDGTILRANVFRPEAEGRYPVLVARTPYGKAGAGSGYERFVYAGYVVVSQDIRGRYASDGEWVPFSVPNTGDAEDGYDTVEWAALRPWCNGKVGTMGASYVGWTQWVLAKLRPPHLVAMCARSIPPELSDVDSPGAFKPARRVHWWLNTMAPDLRRRKGLPPPHTPVEAKAIWNDIEHGSRLGLHPWSKILKYLPPGLVEYAEAWFKNPDVQAWGIADSYAEVDVPNFDITGWYDHCNGSIRHLAGLQQQGRSETARKQSRLIIGPWNHVSIGNRQQGPVDFGLGAELDTIGLTIRWFDYWLKGVDTGVDRDPPVRYFLMGALEWRSASTWPPDNTTTSDLFLAGEDVSGGVDRAGVLQDRPPDSDHACGSYTYDPDDPVPTLWSDALFSSAADRHQLEYRRDILYYLTSTLEEDVDVVGEPEVVLYASSSAPDTDFFARLIDDEPGGLATEVSYGMIRARYRGPGPEACLLAPGEVTEFRIRLGPTACRFCKGHRIRLEITSSDFPNHDRNHNVGRNDLYDAEMVTAEQSVFHCRQHPSRLVLPVLPWAEN